MVDKFKIKTLGNAQTGLVFLNLKIFINLVMFFHFFKVFTG